MNNNFSLFQAARIARLMFFLVQSAFLLLLLPTSSFGALGNEAPFTECLDLHSNPQYPTSEVTYSQHNSSFTSMLQAYARNIRFLKPETRKPSFIVTPKGRRALVWWVLDRKAMGEDMFWALRGGVARSLDQGASRTMYRWQEVAPNLPKDLFLRARVSVIKDQKEDSKNRLAFTFIALFLGESKELQDLLAKSFPELGISAKYCQEMPWINSTLFWDDIPSGTSTEILLSREYERLSRKVKSDYVTKPIPEERLQLMWKEVLDMDGLVMEWNPYGGRMREIPANEIAFYHRAGNLFKIEYDFKWYEEGKEAEEHHIELSRRLYKFMTPYVSNSPKEAFYNYRDLDLGTNTGRFAKTRAEFGNKYHGGNFQRLLKVKLKVDPLNFFRDEQSIPPILNLT
uniref:Berberine/berberine-like domain-containing protein n=1 Tax=Chenopodium quinoa TaxID=63459 RepID=A0A803KVU0_CHEQI